MAINDINKLRLLNLFQGSDVGENRVQPPVFGTPTPKTDINAAQSYEDLFPPPENDISQVRVQNVLNAKEGPKSEELDINQLYTPETRATERFNKLLEEFPERGQPSFMDKLAGAGAYLGNLQRHIPGGQKAAEEAKYAGFNRELEDWKERTVPFGTAEAHETQQNVNERNLAATILKDRQTTRALEEKERAATANEQIKRDNQALVKFQFDNPHLKLDTTGEKVRVWNPKTGEMTETKYETRFMDDLTKITINNAAAQKRAETVAAAAETRANITADASAARTEAGGWIPVQIPDPKDPTKTITARMNTRTGETAPVTFEGQTSPATKLGTPGSGKLVQPANLVAIQGMTKEVLTLLDNEVLDSSGKEPKLNSKVEAGVGWSTWDPRQYLPESEQRAAARTIGRLKDMLTLQLIGEMKAQSKTGATGFGQLTGRELDVLESAAAKLDPAMDRKTLIAEFVRIREKLQKVMLPPDGLNPTVTKTPSTVYSGEVMVEEINTGRRFAVRDSELANVLATKRYRQVQ